MAMWRGGQLDGDMAMQLLGLQLTTGSSSATSNLEAGAPTGDTGNDSKKRPISQVTPSEPEESLEDVLEQAKKAKNETWLCWFITLFPSQNKKWKNSQHDNKLTLTTWIRTYCLNRCQHRGPLRRKTPWRQSWGVCASPKKMGSCKFHSGSMTSGRMEITWPWPNSLHSATSTRIANQQSMQFIHCIFASLPSMLAEQPISAIRTNPEPVESRRRSSSSRRSPSQRMTRLSAIWKWGGIPGTICWRS